MAFQNLGHLPDGFIKLGDAGGRFRRFRRDLGVCLVDLDLQLRLNFVTGLRADALRFGAGAIEASVTAAPERLKPVIEKPAEAGSSGLCSPSHRLKPVADGEPAEAG